MTLPTLTVTGLNHATAPLAVREAVAVEPGRAASVVRRAAGNGVGGVGGGEAILLNTCNRVELYQVGGAADPLEVLCEGRTATPAEVAGVTYSLAGDEAVSHLFHVTAGLGSMVLGESQILGQVRHAHDLARREGTAGAVLNPLVQRAVAAGREVLRDTELGGGRASVGGVAVQYAEQIFGDLDGHTVLMIGAGETGRLVLGSLRRAGRRTRLLVCNRTPGKAQKLVAEIGGEAAAVGWADLPRALAEADVVVSSTASREAVVTADLMAEAARARRYRPVFLMDLAVPRDIDPACGELREVYRYDLDDLQRVVSATLGRRERAVAEARAVVARHLDAYHAWARQRSLGPTIRALYQRQHALADAELEKTLAGMPGLTEADKQRLRRSCRRMVNRLLHDPVTAMRAAPQHAAHSNVPNVYRHAVEKLFKLDDPVLSNPVLSGSPKPQGERSEHAGPRSS